MCEFQIAPIADDMLEAATRVYGLNEFLLSDPERDRTWGIL